ncbi:MAG: RDD family protein [bacterium]|jgi:uncharacterized RDD family membrane protein YckC
MALLFKCSNCGEDKAAKAEQEAPDQTRFLASRWKRLLGYMIDSALVAIPSLAIAWLSAPQVPPGQAETPHQFFLRWVETPWAALLTVIVIAVGALQAYLLVTRGQTVGKRILGTRIVTMDFRHPSWWRLVLVRPLILLLSGMRPRIQWTDSPWGGMLGLIISIVSLVNALFVFNSDRRALHDHLAGTQVIDLKRMGISNPRSSIWRDPVKQQSGQ